MAQHPDSPWSSYRLATDEAIRQLDFPEVERLLATALDDARLPGYSDAVPVLEELAALFDDCIERMLPLRWSAPSTPVDHHDPVVQAGQRERSRILERTERQRLAAYRLLLTAQEVSDGPNSLVVAETLFRMGIHTWDVAEPKAFPFIERTLAIRDAMLGAKHPDTLDAVRLLAGMCSTMIMYRQVIPLWERYVASLEGPRSEKDDEQSRAYRGALIDLGKAHNALGNHVDAAEAWQRLLAYVDVQQLRDEARAEWHEFFGRGDGAADSLRAERFADSVASIGDGILDGYSGAGRAYLALQEWSEAECFLREAVRIHQESPDHTITEHNGAADLELGATQHDYARALRALGRTEEALPYFRQAVDNILGHKCGPRLASRSRVPDLLAEYAAALQDVQRPEATAMQQRADTSKAEWEAWKAEIARRNAQRGWYGLPAPKGR